MGFLLSPFLGRRKAFWFIAPTWVRQMAGVFGIQRQMVGWERLPEEIRDGRQPAIYLANHASLFDPPLIVSTLPCRPVFIAKKELARVPILGWIISLAGFIFIDRSHRARAMESLRSAAERIRDGQSIAAFPEGTRTRTGNLLPFKKGIFNLAWEAGVPVIPMGIQGGFRILPPGHWRVNPGHYVLSIGQPLSPESFEKPDELRLASEAAMESLLSDFQEHL